MAGLIYKDRLIVAFASFDETTTFWIPMANISGVINDQRRSHQMTGPRDRFKNWEDAEQFMIETAKAWVDDQT